MNYLILNGVRLPNKIFEVIKHDVDFANPSAVVEEENIILNSPFFSETIESAQDFMHITLQNSSILILIDLNQDLAYVYRGPSVPEIKKVFLPRFFKLYNLMTHNDEPCLSEIRDLRNDALKQPSPLYHFHSN